MQANWDKALAEHCAPVLMKRKPAALFCAPIDEEERPLHAQRLAKNGLEIDVMPGAKGQKRVLVYCPALLHKALQDATARCTLQKLGYPMHCPLRDILAHLEHKICENEVCFPHEIGFFLGYPPEDVLGFMHNRGARYKHCGIWKVYSDVERAKALFSEYSACKSAMLAHVHSGKQLENFCFDGESAG